MNDPRSRLLSVSVLLLAALLALGIPLSAQDTTPEATVEATLETTPAVDVTAEPVDVTPEPTEEIPAAFDDAIRADRLGITFISSVDIPFSEERYEHALELGAGWNRWPLYWPRVETEPGEFDWSAYDELIADDLAYGFKTDVILLGMPEFYRDEESIAGLNEPIYDDGTDSPGPDKRPNPENPWAVFVFEAAERYRPGGTLATAEGWDEGQGVTLWEIWNEPDFAQFWGGGVYNYARMLKIAYRVIHQADPDARVMFGGLLYGNGGENWLAQVLGVYLDTERNPGAENWFMDAVAIHSYGNAWRSGWLTLVARQTLVEYQIDKPIFLNESGVAVWDDYPGPTWMEDDPGARFNRATANQQAAFFIQSTAYAWAYGAHTVFFHQLYDDCGDQAPGTDFAPDDTEQFGDAFGIFRNRADSVCYSQHPNPDTARPVGDAYQLLAEVFGSAPFSARAIVEDTRDDGIVLLTFTRLSEGERLIVIWNTTTEPRTLALDAVGDQAQVYGIGFERTIRPFDGQYSLDLNPALTPNRRGDASGAVDIGGDPIILVEEVNSRMLRDLIVRTLDNTGSVEAVNEAAANETPAPALMALEPEVIEELQAESPTGVIFISLNTARLRNAPNTENSSVIGGMSPYETANVIGRTEDSGWLQVDAVEGGAWVAAFLGETHGDIESLPVIDVPLLEAPAEGTETPE